MEEDEQEAIKNDPILKKLRKESKKENATAFMRNISLCLFNPNLLASQAFCLFVYGSCGAITPYLPLYFKQFGLEPFQVGIILGIAPVIQCLASPIWAALASKWHVQKLVFLCGVLSFLVKLLLILAVQPDKQYCLQSYINSTSNLTYHRSISLKSEIKENKITAWTMLAPPNPRKAIITTPITPTTGRDSRGNDIKEDDASALDVLKKEVETVDLSDPTINHKEQTSRHLLAVQQLRKDFKVFHVRNKARSVLKHTSEFDPSLNETVKYVITVDKYELKDIFLIFVMFFLVCDFLQAPTFALGDGSVLDRIQEDHHPNPTKMRFSGSVGFIASTFLAAAIISRSVFKLCGIHRVSYYAAFYFSIGFVGMAFVNSLWFEYIYDLKPENEKETWKKAMGNCAKLRNIAYAVSMIYISLCSGFLAPFLNWYIDDLGGSTLLVATVCATREAMIMLFYMAGSSLVSILGHINVMLFSLMSYAVCFLCYWLVQNSWICVGVVAVEGATFALMWTSCEQYIKHLKESPDVSIVTKNVLHTLFWGIAYGGGAMVGGVLYGWLGGRQTFNVLMVATIVVLIIVVILVSCSQIKTNSKEDQEKILDSDED